jgi:hypothetical protein
VVLSHGTGVRIPVPVPSFARLNRERASDGKPASSRDQDAKDVHRSANREGGPRARPIRASYGSRHHHHEAGPHVAGVANLPCDNGSYQILRQNPAGHCDAGSFPDGKTLAHAAAMSTRFLYVLRNQESPPKYYTGLTSDVAGRLGEHHAGRCPHTADETVHGPSMSRSGVECNL